MIIHVNIDPAQLCRGFFILAAAAAIGANAVPTVRQLLVSYGPRSTPTENDTSPAKTKSKEQSGLDLGTILQVPHSYFTHYYIVSVISSAFWAYQLLTNGTVFKFLASHRAENSAATMTMNQVFITWGCMTLQGGRRLYECLTLLKPSPSKMPLTSWALGIAFYLVVGISVWIEGTTILMPRSHPLEGIIASGPSLKTFLGIPLFFLASVVQHKCHKHLASLKKYTLPNHQLFRWITCPHYTSECGIYLALGIISAPPGQILNKTMLTALLFTIVNLAITADSTRAWYARKFGQEKIEQRWRILPFLY